MNAPISCVSLKNPQRYLRRCEYIDIQPRCSCKDCNIYVGREGGNILCCNEYMFTYQEIARASAHLPEPEVDQK